MLAITIILIYCPILFLERTFYLLSTEIKTSYPVLITGKSSKKQYKRQSNLFFCRSTGL